MVNVSTILSPIVDTRYSILTNLDFIYMIATFASQNLIGATLLVVHDFELHRSTSFSRGHS